MTTETEQTEQTEQPVIIASTKEQVRTLVEAGTLAEKADRYDKNNRSNGRPMVWFNDGRNQTYNATLSEYLKRAEEKIVNERMSEIISAAKEMIEKELDQIREILK